MVMKRGVRSHGMMAEDLWKLRLVGDPQVSPDARYVAFVVTEVDVEEDGYCSTIWLLDTNDPDRTRQLTDPIAPARLVRETSPRWSPDGQQLAFVSNRDGKKRIWLITLDQGEARPAGDSFADITGLCWSPSGTRLAFSAKSPDKSNEGSAKTTAFVTDQLPYKLNGEGLLDPKRHRHLWVLDLASHRTHQLTNAPFNDYAPCWAPDETHLLFTSDRNPPLDLYYVPDLYRVELADQETRRLTRGEGPVQVPQYAPDGKAIAFYGHRLGDDMTANVELWLTDSRAQKGRSLTVEWDRSVGNSIGSDVRFDEGGAHPVWFAGGDRLLYTVTSGGNCELFEVDRTGNHQAIATKSPVIQSFSVNLTGEPLIAFVGTDWDCPGDLWILRPDEDDPVRCTHFNDELFSRRRLAKPERVTYEGEDGWPLEGWLMKPIGYKAGERYPLVLEIHGGPALTSGNVFYLQYQLLAAAGWGVMYNNPRGSKGYGASHARQIIGDWGGVDYRDLMAATRQALEKPWVDAERLGVTGGSYGGYMTNWIISQTHCFKAAVTFRCISNLYTKYGCADLGFHGNRKGMGGADLWDSEDFIMSRSPIRYAPQVNTPVLIVHAEEDHRCPMEQAEQWYVALRRLGVTCQFVRYAGENHELSRSGRPHNRVDRLTRLLDWFNRHLFPN